MFGFDHFDVGGNFDLWVQFQGKCGEVIDNEHMRRTLCTLNKGYQAQKQLILFPGNVVLYVMQTTYSQWVLYGRHTN